MRIALQFVPEQSPAHRARLEYAFRLFCTVYGHRPLIGLHPGADIVLGYAPDITQQPALCLTNGYVVRPTALPAPEPIPYERIGINTVLFHEPLPGREPDWLGEIFEWVSCADEYSIGEHDGAGRVPFSSSYIGRHRLDPCVPYAAVAMHFLQMGIERVCPRCSQERQRSRAFLTHMVVNTHDIDFLGGHKTDSSYRLAKNAVISFLLRHSPKAAANQAAHAVSVAMGGKDPLDQIPRLAAREFDKSITSSYYVLCRHGHRRDGNYHVGEPGAVEMMRHLPEGMEIGVHGSYCSLEDSDGLAVEFDRLRELGFNPIGGRQHWLRFTMQKLVNAVRQAGAAYDASLGWPDVIGYRAGACFAFPPYDFEREAAAPFLEVPLAVMDQSVSHRSGMAAIRDLLKTSRRYAWGGISVLWHPTAFGGGQFSENVGNAFWELLEEGLQEGDTWLSGASFVRTVWNRYAGAGLLPAGRFS